MTATAKRSALSVAFRIINAADMLCVRGAEPQRALRIVLGTGDMGDLSPEIEAMARAIWAGAIGSDGSGSGRAAALERLSRIVTCVETLCSFGVEP